MHVVGVNLDLSLFLQLITTAFVVVVALLYAVKKTASKYFEVDASFEGDQAVSCRSSMPGVLVDDSSCFVCGDPGSKKCSRCKRVRYCSPKCQEKHWNSGHKTDCKVFQPSQSLSSAQNGLNGSHYQNLNGGSKSCNGIALVPSRGFSKPVNIKQLKEVLFPYNEFVKLFNWDKPGYLPCGLLNCGNSCFVNVVLQCLASTRPLVAYLLEKGHRSECIRSDWCFLCELQTHIERASHSPQAFSPTNIISRLPNIGGNLGYGRQEDAHEFMRFAIDTMQSVCLDEFGGEKAVPPTLQETTVIQHIFGGHLQSQVICTNCNNISNQYENMMDLTVEIHGEATSLEECLDQFTAEECLQGDNMYKCDGCNDYVKAWKRLTIKEPPNILTIALKRFQSGRFGKLNKRVTFPESLNLSVYTNEAGESGDGEDEDLYNLYAVLVHVDMLNASFFGHYICYVKDFSGNWYRLDDCKVARVDLEEVLSQGAYMLFYSRVKARPSCLRARKEVQSIVANGEAVDLSPEDEDCPLTNGSSPVGVVISPSNTSFLTSKSETPVEANSDSITEHLNNPPPILGLSTPCGEEEEDTSNSSVSSSSSSSSESSSSSSSNGFDRVSVDVSSDRECMEVTRFGSAFEEKPYPENGFSGLDRERRNGTHLVESKGMEICSDDQIESTMQVEENVQKGIGLCSSMLRADIGSSQMWVDLQIENGNRSDSVDVTE